MENLGFIVIIVLIGIIAYLLFGKKKEQNALPPSESIPTSGYVPPNQSNWRDTNDLAQPSVTEGTTKLLEKD